MLVRPQELAKQADSPETDSHCPDCQTWAQKGNCEIERHLPFGRRGARSPCERPICNCGGRRVQDTWREARQTEEAQAHAQEQRGRLRARNRLDLPRVRGRRGRPRALARALGGTSGLWLGRSEGGAEASGLRQGRLEEGGRIRARKPSGSVPRAVADKARAPRKGAEPLGQESGFQKAAAFLPPTGSNRVLPAHDHGEGAFPMPTTARARDATRSRPCAQPHRSHPRGGGDPQEVARETIRTEHGFARSPPLLSARSTRIGAIPSATRLRGRSPAIGAQNSQPYYGKEFGNFRQYFTIRSAEGHSEGKTRVKTGRNRLPLFDIQRKRYTICYS